MNMFVVLLLGIVVSIVLSLLTRRSFTLGTILLGSLGAVLGELVATVVFSDYQFANLVVPTLVASFVGSVLLVLSQKLLVR